MAKSDTPPMALDSERAVLGGCLLDASCLSLASRTLEESDFFDARHRQVFRAV